MKRPVRTLIVDDEAIARRRLRHLLTAEADIEVVGECSDGLQACAAIGTLAPDLVLLDVEMPERDGLEVVRWIGAAQMPATVFATAYDHYALAAFDANALDYLLKPFDAARLARALSKVRTWLAADALAEHRRRLGQAMHALPTATRLLVRTATGQQLVRIDDILYISAKGNYVHLHTLAGVVQMRERMVGMLERLDPARFRRIHRSRIVNLDHVRKLLPWFGGDQLVMLSDGTRLTLSRTYRSQLEMLG